MGANSKIEDAVSILRAVDQYMLYNPECCYGTVEYDGGRHDGSTLAADCLHAARELAALMPLPEPPEATR